MIDLKARYRREYRITLDESATIPGQTQEERLWLYRIPCKYGHIYVHGTDTLGAYTDRRLIVSRLIALPGVKVHQRGDSECSVTFQPEHLENVAQLLQARRRRQVPEAERQRLAQMSATHGFKRNQPE